MYIIRSGILNTVLTTEQYDEIKRGELNPQYIQMHDTIREFVTKNNEVVEYLPFKISYKDTDRNGKDKYIFNEETKEFQPSYFYSPVIYAYGKELRILLELGVYAPVKIVYQEQWNDGNLYRTLVCVQDQRTGLIDDCQ